MESRDKLNFNKEQSICAGCHLTFNPDSMFFDIRDALFFVLSECQVCMNLTSYDQNHCFTYSSCPLQVENTNEIFESKKDQPPIQNEPPVAGAIRWAQFLFHRLKQTIILFLKVPEMLKCELINVVN